MTQSPDEFLAAYPVAMRGLAIYLRTLVRRALPDCIEAVKPGWKLIGLHVPAKTRPVYVGFIIPHPATVTLGFEYGILLADPGHHLLGASEHLKQVRYLSFAARRDVNAREVDACLRQAAEVALMPRLVRAELLRQAGK